MPFFLGPSFSCDLPGKARRLSRKVRRFRNSRILTESAGQSAVYAHPLLVGQTGAIVIFEIVPTEMAARNYCNVSRIVVAVAQISFDREGHNVAEFPPVDKQDGPQLVVVILLSPSIQGRIGRQGKLFQVLFPFKWIQQCFDNIAVLGG